MKAAFCLAGALATVITSVSTAAPIGAGTTAIPTRAIQDVTLLPNTPFNPTAEPIVFEDLSGEAVLGLTREAQVGDTIDYVVFGVDYRGFHPMLGDYVFGAAGPIDGSDFSGQITSVVQDAADPGFATGDPSSFQSGDLFVTGAQFAFEFLSGPAAGAVLVTDPTQDFAFEASLDGLPPSPGTLFTAPASSDQVIDVLFNGVKVGESSNRRLLVIPEPGSAILLALGALAAIGRQRPR